MTDAQQHIVRKFSLELETADNGGQYALQQRCSDIVKEKMAPALDEIFTAYFQGDIVTRINKIEIDLGNIDADKLEEVFIQECINQLKEKIKNFAAGTASGETIPAQLLTKAQHLLLQFFYFLETGAFPLTAKDVKVKEWEQKIIEAVKAQKDFFTAQFQQLIQQRPSAAERLAAQFSIDFIIAMFNAAGVADEHILKEALKKLRLQITGQRRRKQRKLLTAALIQLLYGGQIKDRREFLITVTKNISAAPAPYAAHFQTAEEWKQYLYAFYKKDFSAKEENVLKKAYTQTPEKTKEIQKYAEQKAAVADAIKSDGVFIDNAGLVILHPFLETLFETLGFTQNKSFVDDASRNRAVHLLQYMATNEEAMPEYLMPLNKLLCGIPAEEHIERFITLHENEKKEAQELLQAIINHWSILKHTSVEGLQEAFLRRRGKLSFNKTDAYWKLQAEKSTLDILLDKLPWGYSYLQLPWMQHRLITEWQS